MLDTTHTKFKLGDPVYHNLQIAKLVIFSLAESKGVRWADVTDPKIFFITIHTLDMIIGMFCC